MIKQDRLHFCLFYIWSIQVFIWDFIYKVFIYKELEEEQVGVNFMKGKNLLEIRGRIDRKSVKGILECGCYIWSWSYLRKFFSQFYWASRIYMSIYDLSLFVILLFISQRWLQIGMKLLEKNMAPSWIHFTQKSNDSYKDLKRSKIKQAETKCVPYLI